MFILIGGHPKGFSEPFHIKTKSGKILRKILGEPQKEFLLFLTFGKTKMSKIWGLSIKKFWIN